MAEISPPPVPTQLIVFADDWGRHPSSSQHLIRELLPHYPTIWVNTVGTRMPKLTLADLQRGYGVLASWLGTRDPTSSARYPDGFRLVAPKMYPGYRNQLQRWFNRGQVARAVHKLRRPNHRCVVITTLPTTADLIGHLGADRWLYYCVDDYAQWPGTDHIVMQQMERELLQRVDGVAAVSEVLESRATDLTKGPTTRLEHGVDVNLWATPRIETQLAANWPDDRKPIALFWGLIDERMDVEWVKALSANQKTQIAMAGPKALGSSASIDFWSLMLGPVEHADLPAYAAASNVLIMPYIDAPVTRAMQPLKLKEYLATMKPVVVRDLPATRDWADCCDLASDSESFVRLVQERSQTGTPPEQIEARHRRLASESWTAKAAQLAELINAD
jgi:glycosyltransferase involved in cell wall biosynthesis